MTSTGFPRLRYRTVLIQRFPPFQLEVGTSQYYNTDQLSTRILPSRIGGGRYKSVQDFEVPDLYKTVQVST